MDAPVEAQKDARTNSYRHFAKPQYPTQKGQFIWQNRDKKEFRRCLKNFVIKASPLIEKWVPGLNTQLNESLHPLKAKLADKNYNWKASWLARSCVEILNWNKRYSWRFEMYDELGLTPLGSDRLDFLKKEDEDQKTRKKLCVIALHEAMNIRR
jgi:hypothetical protein